MADRTPEMARAQIAYALQAKRDSLAAAALALREAPEDPEVQRMVDRLTEDVGRLEIQLRGAL
ncbi:MULTISPECIES: hypothetical protein [Methylobacterium]|jgi:hypothetical protein|uniref:Uncharacterized protein n=3 Tax=Methylobacteriaceae TaxID=119045 RepID=A0A0C6FGD8_9HYPH|nr:MULTISPECIES: hypothetical protein [Methylobacterium]MBZ6416877.1 hypothetical protein [Methylobacterium sp.]MBK3398365.1 hypothetical protein [Methylobacterium ajmalii]MBK3410480.1 hypothetical protein [Methylobacterium ajmalii]MBK3421050.1 hypothetical protein [Methylobacterium ajmalii]SFE94753.1 hypothetical protein SAMN04487844_10815 [Methylobacterium sp. yr596]